MMSSRFTTRDAHCSCERRTRSAGSSSSSGGASSRRTSIRSAGGTPELVGVEHDAAVFLVEAHAQTTRAEVVVRAGGELPDIGLWRLLLVLELCEHLLQREAQCLQLLLLEPDRSGRGIRGDDAQAKRALPRLPERLHVDAARAFGFDALLARVVEAAPVVGKQQVVLFVFGAALQRRSSPVTGKRDAESGRRGERRHGSCAAR